MSAKVLAYTGFMPFENFIDVANGLFLINFFWFNFLLQLDLAMFGGEILCQVVKHACFIYLLNPVMDSVLSLGSVVPF